MCVHTGERQIVFVAAVGESFIDLDTMQAAENYTARKDLIL